MCCADTRVALGCSGDGSTPCRGFTGSCADLAATYYPLVSASLSHSGPRAVPVPVCNAFPTGSSRDAFLSGLISAVCALPVASLVSTLFSLSMSTDMQQPHARVRMLVWPLRARLLLGRFDWHFAAAPRSARLRRRIAAWWATSWSTDLVVAVTDVVTRGGAAELQPHPDAAAAHAFDALTLAWCHAGFVFLYAVWAVFSWIIIVYGALIYRLLASCRRAHAPCSAPADTRAPRTRFFDPQGPQVEESFARSWAVSIGLGQLSDMQSFLITTVQVLLAATVLDALWLLPNRRWLETQLDFASVQASSLQGAGTSWWRGAVTYLRHMKSVH